MLQRIGSGFDVHRYEEGRPMVLGGVTIPYEKGLKGHSDADVVLHAVMDSMLGAAGIANMWAAVFADVGVAVICILNSMRMITSKGM